MFRLFILAAFVLVGVLPASAVRYSDCGQTKNLDRSIRSCTKIIKRGKRESRKNRTSAYTIRGNAYDNKGQYDQAIADFTKAIEINPRYAKAYTNRGSVYNSKGQADRAIADYGKAIEINPRYANAYNNRGIAYEKKKLRDKAIADYRAALEVNPSSDWTRKALKRLGVEP
jgi:tetratricopeptide (TPR) repeat protein